MVKIKVAFGYIHKDNHTIAIQNTPLVKTISSHSEISRRITFYR